MDNSTEQIEISRVTRGQRYFCINGSWYFNTRAGQRGPFTSKQIMQDELDRYLIQKTGVTLAGE